MLRQQVEWAETQQTQQARRHRLMSEELLTTYLKRPTA
jgi:hypothetical protein